MPRFRHSENTRMRVTIAAWLLILVQFAARGGESPEKPAETRPPAKPITTAQGPLAELLKKWHAEGTAVGNVGDYYDNRDRGHSDLNTALYPQLQRVEYPEEAKRLRLDWAAQSRVLPMVVFGNSSTSAGVHQGGSNPRMLYTRPNGLRLLYIQYTGNNLYIYPEHQDHDPGHNGSPGHGDLFPTNTPYLMISQGSSGSDQPFMNAVASTMAAFRPETKKKLIDSGLLMPAMQMIFRMSNKQVANAKDYLSGKAHPTVFQGHEVDAVKMARTAHEMKADEVPPMVSLEVVEEDASAAPGRDYFEEDASEALADTPAVIARVCRGRSHARRIVVSAAKSYDRNNRSLKYHWAVLRGDAGRIEIKPLDAEQSRVEILVPWHERRPVAEGSPLESNRVDIGVFLHNGVHYSAPGFITFLFLDHEARTYDDAGRLIEIGYGMGESEIQVADWFRFGELLKPDTAAPGARLLRRAFSATETAALLRAIDEYRVLHVQREAAAEQRKRAETDKKPENELKTLREAEQAAAKSAEEVLDKRRDALQGAPREVVVARLRRLIGNPMFHAENAVEIEELLREGSARPTHAELRKRFAGWGLFAEGPEEKIVLQGVHGTAAPDVAQLTRFEKALLEQYHGELLSRLLLPGVARWSWKVNFVDPAISAPKAWRDVYRYDAAGNCTGWMRYDGRLATEFNAQGMMVLEKDSHGRCLKARAVRYEQEKPKSEDPQRHFGPNWNLLRCLRADEVVFYEYTGDTDSQGRIVNREKEEPAK